jgi:hypothetical protein
VTYTPQTWVANTTVVSAARMNYIESGLTAAAAGGGGGITEVAYAQITTDTTCTFGSSITIVTAPAFTADGTSVYMIEFYAIDVRSGVNANLYIQLYEGATFVGAMGYCNGTPNALSRSMFAVRRITPSSGSHTYKIVGEAATANGFVNSQAGGNINPTFIRILKN